MVQESPGSQGNCWSKRSFSKIWKVTIRCCLFAVSSRNYRNKAATVTKQQNSLFTLKKKCIDGWRRARRLSIKDFLWNLFKSLALWKASNLLVCCPFCGVCQNQCSRIQDRVYSASETWCFWNLSTVVPSGGWICLTFHSRLTSKCTTTSLWCQPFYLHKAGDPKNTLCTSWLSMHSINECQPQPTAQYIKTFVKELCKVFEPTRIDFQTGFIWQEMRMSKHPVVYSAAGIGCFQLFHLRRDVSETTWP